jgi:hypothetical protein
LPRDAQLGGGARRAGDEPVRLPQCGLDHFSFMVYKVRDQGNARRGSLRSNRR